MSIRISDLKRGDWLTWQGVEILVTRVARDASWADIRCKELGSNYEWRKRQRLPMPEGTERRPAS